ncbi:MAG TPA: phage protein Gp36 family protein [Streptosporangiaceae bacterium]|jgi:hypothetical protein
MAGPLYATVAQLQSVLDGTDSGTGTAAQLTPAQLTLALQSASDRVSVYFGNVMDSSTPQATPPSIFQDLTLDLAAFWAAKTYMKNKVIDPQHPIFIAYKDATQMLQDARDGKLRLDVVAPGGVSSEIGVIINRVPPVFNGNDSNTRVNRYTGYLESDTPVGQWSPGRSDDLSSYGPIYQG